VSWSLLARKVRISAALLLIVLFSSVKCESIAAICLSITAIEFFCCCTAVDWSAMVCDSEVNLAFCVAWLYHWRVHNPHKPSARKISKDCGVIFILRGDFNGERDFVNASAPNKIENVNDRAMRCVPVALNVDRIIGVTGEFGF